MSKKLIFAFIPGLILLASFSLLNSIFKISPDSVLTLNSVVLTLLLALTYLLYSYTKINLTHVDILKSEINRYKKKASEYEDKLKSTQHQISDEYSESEKLSKKKDAVIFFEFEYMSNNLVILDSFLNAIMDQSLEYSHSFIKKTNVITKETLKQSDEAVKKLSQLINKEDSSTSFAYVEESAKKLNDMNAMLDNIIVSSREEEKYLNEVENKINTIKELTKNLDDISEKTNVLSFNASIEAAKSGKGSKGFSVIASEIKKLAANAKESVAAIQVKVNESSKAVDILKEKFKQMLAQFSDQISISKNELQSIFGLLKDSYEQVSQSVEMTSNNTQSSTKNLSDLVYFYTQNQDILSQQITHIKSILAVVQKKLITVYNSMDNKEVSDRLEQIGSIEIKNQVVADFYKILTMDFEREVLKKVAIEKLKLDSFTSVVGNSDADKEFSDHTKDIMGEDVSDSIVLF